MYVIPLRAALLLGLLTLVACGDAATLPEMEQAAATLNTAEAPDDASQSPSCCDPVIVVVDAPEEECDPYTQLDFSCDGDGGGQCMTSVGSGGGEYQTASGCDNGDGGGAEPPPDGCSDSFCSDGGGGIPGDGDSTCDPAIHPECEKPLTAEDQNTIGNALATMLRPAAQFTDSIARRECAEMEAAFRQALSEGAVFRGAFDSDDTNDQYGSHWGMYSGGRIHFDPASLDAANSGDAAALREVAITALHEAGHWSGFSHGDPAFDGQGRDYYTATPFDRLNPGENSCVSR
jgi:hypothetical protein